MIRMQPKFQAEAYSSLTVSAEMDEEGDVFVVINGIEYVLTALEAHELTHVIAQAIAPEAVPNVPPAQVASPEEEPEDILARLFNQNERLAHRLGTAGQARQIPADFGL